MKKIFVFSILVPFFCLSYGQVKTTFFATGKALEQVKHIREQTKTNKIRQFASFDVQELLNEDSQNKNMDVPFRFGKAFDTNITLSDGEWEEVENGRLWSMEFQSRGAYSINFVFNGFFLPDSAELYIANKAGTVLYGPVTSKQNTRNGFLLTDLIEGDDVTIYIFEPEKKKGQAQLTIKRVVHAYKNLFSNMSYGNFGGSESCNNDISCFPDWDNESDAVALVLLSTGTEWCSGSLLMNANSNFTPYFLSAFHCIDATNPDGNLSATEISNAENWMFKFQYKRSSCNGNTATTGITFNGAIFRSGWNISDFVLMEMNNSPIGNSEFTCLGWDRSGLTPTSGTCIHHPAGDVMKISFEQNQFQMSSWGAINNHWLLNFDNGVVQKGSSGSPIFDQNRRVVGQLHGNQNYNPNLSFCLQTRAEYGCFHLSWNGGGTNTTRLSNWIDPNNTGIMTTNTSRYPSLSGPSQICNQGAYTINYLPPGASVTWSSSPTGYLQLVSGQGTSTAIFSKISNKNNIIISAVISINGASFTIYKSGIQTGTPLSSFEKYDAATDFQVTRVFVNKNYYFYGVENAIEDDDYQWTITSPSPYPVTTAIDGRQAYYTASKVGSHLVTLQYNGACGWSDIYSEYVNFEPSKKTLLALSPNPATEIVTVAVTENASTDNSILSLNNSDQNTIETDYHGTYKIQLWNENSGLVKTLKSEQSKLQISLSGLPKGMYYVHLIIEGKTIQKKILWLK